MSKGFVIILFFISAHGYCDAQMCPGGGTDLASAQTFDPGWIYGCTTGTSCNGGVHFDNRSSCEPTGPIDACAPAPSCTGGSANGSDIWFAFYPSKTTVTLTSFQNTSFVIGLQAFGGGPSCGSLTTIGCAVASGPSSGVSLPLTGLTIGQRYYFRVFGSANNNSQRSGIFCMCGTTGLDQTVLTPSLLSFTVRQKNDYTYLQWSLQPDTYFSTIEVQKSTNGIDFTTVQRIKTRSANGVYSFIQTNNSNTDMVYYRLRLTADQNDIQYSHVLTLKYQIDGAFTIVSNVPGKPVILEARKPSRVQLYDYSGHSVRSYSLNKGRQTLMPQGLVNGVYFLKDDLNSATHKILIFQ